MKLIVTRPEPDGAALAEALHARGHEPLRAPLMTVRFRPADPATFEGAQALLFTSANGVRAFAAARETAALPDLPALAVGAATAKAARDAGLALAATAGGDVETLAETAASGLDAARGPLVHVTGHVQAGDLAGSLAGKGFAVRQAVLYAAEAAERLPAAVAAALVGAAAPLGVLLYSPRTARLFATLAHDAAGPGALSPLTAFCLSPNVAAALAEAPGAAPARVEVAARPEEEALLALLPDA